MPGSEYASPPLMYRRRADAPRPQLYAIGGDSDGGGDITAECLDLTTNEWAVVPCETMDHQVRRREERGGGR